MTDTQSVRDQLVELHRRKSEAEGELADCLEEAKRLIPCAIESGLSENYVARISGYSRTTIRKMIGK